MRVGTAKHLAVNHASEGIVRPILGSALLPCRHRRDELGACRLLCMRAICLDGTIWRVERRYPTLPISVVS